MEINGERNPGTTWAPVGRPPTVKTTGRRYGLNLISAVSARGDFRFMVQEGNVTAEVFIEFLKRKRSFNLVYPCRLKSPKIVSTYNQVDTYDGEQESFISTIGRGAAERWPLSV